MPSVGTIFRKSIDGYEQLLIGAHRKPAPVVRPPLLVWHLGFWLPLKPVDDEEKSKDARRDRKFDVDDYLIALYKQLTVFSEFETKNLDKVANHILLFEKVIDVAGTEVHPTGPLRRASDAQTVTFKFNWHGTLVTLIAELRAEYLTFTSYLDISVQPPGFDPEAFVLDANVPKEIRALYLALSELNALSTMNAADKSLYINSFERIYVDIWRAFANNLLHIDESRLKMLGEIFADFRALVVAPPLETTQGAPIRSSLYPSRAFSGWKLFQEPFWRFHGDPTPNQNPTSSSQQWLEKLRQFWPFLATSAQVTPITRVDFEKYEFTATRMLGSRALYVSALGAQPSELPTEERFPLFYFLFTEALSGWQIGRLVDRINTLGTLRLAALMNLGKLREAGRMLRVVEEKIKDSLGKIFGVLPDPELQNPVFDDAKRARLKVDFLSYHITGIGEQMANINKMFATEPLGDDLEYRLERARYYIEQFRRNARPLRIGRLEGFQPYDVMVERRLGFAFDYIDMVTTRFGRVRSDIAALHQTYVAHQARLAELITSIQNEEIKYFQEVADFALWVALIPYYLGTIFIIHIANFQETDPKAVWIWFTLWALSATFWAWRNYSKMSAIVAQIWRGIQREDKRVLGAVAIFSVGAILTWLGRRR